MLLFKSAHNWSARRVRAKPRTRPCKRIWSQVFFANGLKDGLPWSCAALYADTWVLAWFLSAFGFFFSLFPFRAFDMAILLMFTWPAILEHVPSQLNQGDSLRAKDERVYRH